MSLIAETPVNTAQSTRIPENYQNVPSPIEQHDGEKSLENADASNFIVSIVSYIYHAVLCGIRFLLWLLDLEPMKPDAGSSKASKRRNRPQMYSFEYDPLKGNSEVRLLQLMPGKDDEPLIGYLHHFDLSLHQLRPLDGLPSYEAISYTWGSPRRDYTIQCNNEPLDITTSLKNALRQVRQSREAIHIWADAICINQSDLHERKMQVALMRHIFANAKKVSICLGGASDYTLEDLNVLQAVLQSKAFTYAHPQSDERKRKGLVLYDRLFHERSRLLSVSFRNWSSRMNPPSENLTLQRLAPSAWKALAKFFDNPWFSRIWVVQEVAESKDARILFANLDIPWQNIVNLAKTILKDVKYRANVLPFTETKGVHNVLFMNNSASVSAQDPIPSLLQSTRDFHASDPRDKIYAILHRPIQKPRNDRGVLFLQDWLYIQFSIQSISLLCLLSIVLENSTRDIRFWYLLLALGIIAQHLRLHDSVQLLVFDFYQRFTGFLLKLERVIYAHFPITDTLCNMLQIYADYSLTAPSLYRLVATRVISRSQNLNILSYVNHGASIDTTYPSWVPRWDCPTGGIDVLISLPNHRYRSSAQMKHTLSAHSQHADYLIAEGIRFSTVTSISNVVTLGQSYQLSQLNANLLTFRDVRANELDMQVGDMYPNGESMHRAYIATLTAGRLGHIDQDYATYLPDKFLWRVAAALHVCYGRRQFVTENGYMGMGPAAMQNGDILCVLFGGSVPYVLRATDTNELYRVVGESYVHGIMQGEVIKQWRDGKFVKDRFTLC